MKHNNLLPNQHFRKDWQLHVKCWFDQPGKKKSRRIARVKKALRITPAPLDSLVPIVRCPTSKYNMRVRGGRGFTFDELKLSGVGKKEAKGLGIKVDHRRKNRSQQGLDLNVARLKEYMSRLILLKKGEVGVQVDLKKVLPISDVTSKEQEYQVLGEVKDAYKTLRLARSDKKLKGKREVRAKQKAEEEANKKK
jgi:large subunit ribosomal protein L13e